MRGRPRAEPDAHQFCKWAEDRGRLPQHPHSRAQTLEPPLNPASLQGEREDTASPGELPEGVRSSGGQRGGLSSPGPGAQPEQAAPPGVLVLRPQGALKGCGGRSGPACHVTATGSKEPGREGVSS